MTRFPLNAYPPNNDMRTGWIHCEKAGHRLYLQASNYYSWGFSSALRCDHMFNCCKKDPKFIHWEFERGEELSTD